MWFSASAGEADLISGPGRSPGVGNGNLLQFSCLEYSIDRRAWKATVPEVARVGHNLVTNPYAPYGMLGKYYKNIKKESTKWKPMIIYRYKELLLFFTQIMQIGLPWWLIGKESTCQCRRLGFECWVSKIPWSRKWQPTPVFLLGKSHGQRSLAKSWTWLSK